MKFVNIYLIVILLLSIACSSDCYAQRQFGNNKITGEILDSIDIDINSVVFVTDKTAKDRAFTWPVDVNEDGKFEVDRIETGRYKLYIRVNSKDFIPFDTTVDVSSTEHRLSLNLKAKPCSYDFWSDKKNNELKLIVFGGTAPNFSSKGKFERKYGVGYNVYGCFIPESITCISDYNAAVMNYLDTKYGVKWRKIVRKDVFGLNLE